MVIYITSLSSYIYIYIYIYIHTLRPAGMRMCENKRKNQIKKAVNTMVRSIQNKYYIQIPLQNNSKLLLLVFAQSNPRTSTTKT
jgi:hypothetical protein